MAKPLKPFVRSGGYYPSAKYTPLVYPGGYTTLNAKNGKPEPLNTFVGKIVQFLAKRSLPMVKLEANFTPIQNLNGQEAPYPPGGGKNKLETTLTTETSRGITATVNADGSIVLSGTNDGTSYSSFKVNTGFQTENGVEYILSGGVSTDIFLRDVAASKNDTGSGVTITGDGNAHEIDIRILANTAITGTVVIKPMIRLASVTDDTFAPYSNECQITGHTGCEVYDNGVNQWDEEWGLGGYSSQTGQPVAQSNTIRSKNAIPVKPETEYYIAGLPSSGAAAMYLFWYDINGAYIGSSGRYVKSSVMTAPNNAYYLRFQCNSQYGTTYNHDISINYPSTDHDYHAYSGTTVSISFGTTVYGGKLTVFEDGSGQIDAEWATDSFQSFSGGQEANGYRTAQSLSNTPSSAYPNLLCNMFGCANSYSEAVGNDGNKNLLGVNRAGLILLNAYVNGSYATLAQINALIPQGGCQITYPLAEPVTIPLTASQINTLVGENVVFVNDSDDISVTAYGTEIT